VICEATYNWNIVEKYPNGYPRLAAFMNSDDDGAIFRRFGTLYTRNLLYLQAEIVDLEAQLLELDSLDAEQLDSQWRLARYPQIEKSDGNELRALLCARTRAKLTEYRNRQQSLPPR
jgi:hypothetical protein